jgi:hypothetical protein
VSALALQPFAARVRWEFATPLPMPEWVEIIRDYVEALAGRCGGSKYVIGHIKALAVFPDGGFIRASAVDAARRADAESGGALPDRMPGVTFTLNVLVYGLPFEQAREMAQEAAHAIASARGGNAAVDAGGARHDAYHARHGGGESRD